MDGKPGEGKKLTAELIIQRSKTDKFEKIKNLNLWGNDLEDVSILQQLPNVEVLSLSVNKINSLKDFGLCKKVTELYLRKNSITDLSEVQYLTSLEGLRVLWLWDNPCAEHPQYRPYVIKLLPHLVKLDNTAITAEERTAAQQVSVEVQNGIPVPVSVPTPAPAPSAAQVQAQGRIPPAGSGTSGSQPGVPERPGQKQRPQAARIHHTEEPDIAPLEEENKHLQQKKMPSNEDHSKGQPKSDNILCAVLALLKELDGGSLEIVKREVERKLSAKKHT